MKRYIKPNTEMHSVELQSMIANTIQVQMVNDPSKVIEQGQSGWTDLGKESETISSNSLWDEEE